MLKGPRGLLQGPSANAPSADLGNSGYSQICILDESELSNHGAIRHTHPPWTRRRSSFSDGRPRGQLGIIL